MPPLPRISRGQVSAIVAQLLDGREQLLNDAEFARAFANPEIARLLNEIHARHDVSPMPRSELIELVATLVYSILASANDDPSAP